MWVWATSKGKVKSSDSYVIIDKNFLTGEIVNKYVRNRRSGKIVIRNNHFYVINDGGVEIFNSIYPGYGH